MKLQVANIVDDEDVKLKMKFIIQPLFIKHRLVHLILTKLLSYRCLNNLDWGFNSLDFDNCKQHQEQSLGERRSLFLQSDGRFPHLLMH